MLKKIVKSIQNLICHPYGTLHYFCFRSVFFIIKSLNKNELALKFLHSNLILDNVQDTKNLDLEEIFYKEGKSLSICWMVNNRCPYRCSYCCKGTNGGENTRPTQSVEHYINAFDKIFKHYKNSGHTVCNIFFTGGEPTLWKDLPLIAHKLRILLKKYFKYYSIGLNTNLTKDLKWCKDNHIYFDKILASFHVEFADQEQFLEKLKFLFPHGKTAVRVLLHDKRFNEVTSFAKRIKESCSNYSIEYVPLLESLDSSGGPHQYCDQYKTDFIKNHYKLDFKETKSKMKKINKTNKNILPLARYKGNIITFASATSLIINKQNNFKGWQCQVESNIFIEPDGEILFGGSSCKMSMSVGNIENDIFQPLKNTIICQAEYCNCATDINISKKKS